MIPRDLLRRELELEDDAYGLGAIRYRQARPLPWKEDTPSVEEEANLPPGRRLLKLVVLPTAQAIREFIEQADSGHAGRRHTAVEFFKDLDPEQVAYLTARVAVNFLGSQAQRVATEVASVLIHHIEMLALKERNKPGYVGLIRSSHGKRRASRNRVSALRKLLTKEGASLSVPPRQKFQVGLKALELLSEATGLFTTDLLSPGRARARRVFRLTEPAQKWLEEQHSRSELLEPMLMPMLVRPKRWRSLFLGGYYRRPYGNQLIKGNPQDFLEAFPEADLNPVYEAVNHIQETPWRINGRVLEVMRQVWDDGGNLGGLPPRDDLPMPPRPPDINTNEEALAKWKRAAAIKHEENASLQSKRLAIQQRLWIATKFSPEEAIYFPHTLDFRGRVYPLPAVGIHPQADDTGKALLEFADGAPLGDTGAQWLAIHIANLFGIDKVSFAERVAWTYDHAAELIDSALAPLDGDRFWTTADSPYMALAAIFEFADFLNEGIDYVSHIPIPLDGSNSGLQHFSALLRDPYGATAVNLLPSDTPQDVYSEVALRSQARVDLDDDPEATPWKGGKITRKITKRPTMTFVYSATRYGMQDMILQTLNELDHEASNRGEPLHLEGADNYDAARYLSHVLFEAVSEVVSAAARAMSWLRDVATVAAQAKVPIRWTAPDGLPVLQAYREVFGKRIEAHWHGQRFQLTLAVDGSKLNTRAQANGIAPNFVHSLDAAHLRAVARRAKERGIRHLAVIHDSFGTHAANTDALSEILRETFVEQYRPDLLTRFRDEIAAQLPPDLARQLPPIPTAGSLDIEAVLGSLYIFA